MKDTRKGGLVSEELTGSDNCATILKVLADETRLSVLRQLMVKPKRVGELNAQLRLDPCLLSHHLKVLREAGLVQSKREGKSVRYCLSPQVESMRTVDKTLDLGCCKLSFDV
ncbi:HTH-type transcriptional repressor SmtB [Planctomycetales bacterium 10988]|nr:HTH-type transcriptional repressor SmtB [Planctomycetales bacterium 10988]